MKREDILTELGERLRTITNENGYYSNAGLNVFEWKTSNLDEDIEIQLNYLDNGQELISTEDGQYSFHLWDLNISIMIVSKDLNLSPQSIRKVITDVYKAIGIDATFNGKALTSYAVSDSMNVQQNEKIIADALVQIKIRYRTRAWSED